MDLLAQFTKEKIIQNLSTYEIYYQVALGSLINETKATDIDPTIDFQVALGSIYEFINEIKTIENIELIYEQELRKQAAMDAVQNFINKNLGLVKTGTFDLESIINNINENQFFNPTLQELCQKEIKSNVIKWETIITQDVAAVVYESLLQLQD